jgi:hypothetical protein
MLTGKRTLDRPVPPRLVQPALPEEAPPSGARVVEDTRNLDLTGWWISACWACGTWVWMERRVNETGMLVPAYVHAFGRPFEHCDVTWKVRETLFVPYSGADRAELEASSV